MSQVVIGKAKEGGALEVRRLTLPYCGRTSVPQRGAHAADRRLGAAQQAPQSARPLRTMAAARVLTESDSRAATDALLAGLCDGRWRPGAFGRFLLRAVQRSIRQAGNRPLALAEITLLHSVFHVRANRQDRVWTLTSFALSATHLGMLERRAGIGPATVLTLTRANLPVLTRTRWQPVLALASDIADGRLARALGAETRFGASADSLADAVFWFWFALRNEPNALLRAATMLAWILPVAAVTAGSIRAGRMIDAPRPALLRPAALMQLVLATRAIRRTVPARDRVADGQ